MPFPANALATDVVRFPYDQVHQFASDLLEAGGIERSSAEAAARHLLIADMRGIESHGMARMPAYIGRLKGGLIDPNAEVSIERELGSTLSLNGNNALGLLIGPEAMRRTIAKAQETGICLTTVRGSNHFGIAGAYAVMATEAGLGGMAMTNAVPTGRGRPLVVDLSTSTVAFGKIEIARRAGIAIPVGWAIDENGDSTTDPHRVKGLTTLGGSLEQGSHKGYGLSMMVETFCGPLAGNLWGSRIAQSTSTGAQPGIGHMFMAWRIDAFREFDAFLADMDEFIAELRDCRPNPSNPDAKVIIPGDPEAEAELHNQEAGLPLRAAVLDELATAADLVGVPFTLGM
jgi:LDH2 family malate/lactate/ureidoglycolate dehydrogenase